MNIHNITRMCACIGPQNGEPLCPCRMRGLRKENGRWVEAIDHGPVQPTLSEPRLATVGCICPPGAEKTCQGPLCPRKPVGNLFSAGRMASP